MTLPQKLRIALDIAMTVLLLCVYAFQIIGDTAHIWVGIVIFVLFAVHIFINRHWFKSVFKGTYTFRRIAMAVVNIALVLAAVTMMITGILKARQIHTTTTYWFLLLIGVHLGLHWGIFTKFINKNNFIIITVTRILACLFAAFGVWSFFDRDMFAKLFLGFSFDYWPPARPSILFFAETLSVMGLFIFAAYYDMKIKDTIGGSL